MELLDRLVSAETIDGGRLREAVTKTNDEGILLQILNKDCVAVEVKYHKRCYKRYIFISRKVHECSGGDVQNTDI